MFGFYWAAILFSYLLLFFGEDKTLFLLIPISIASFLVLFFKTRNERLQEAKSKADRRKEMIGTVVSIDMLNFVDIAFTVMAGDGVVYKIFNNGKVITEYYRYLQPKQRVKIIYLEREVGVTSRIITTDRIESIRDWKDLSVLRTNPGIRAFLKLVED